MQPYKSLPAARKSLLRQVVVLIAAALLLCLAGRILTGNRLDVSFVLDYLNDPPKVSDFTISWDGEAIPVEDVSVYQANVDNSTAQMMRIVLHPEKPGKYYMDVIGKDGTVKRSDEIRVDGFLTLTGFSWSSGCFTGDEAVILASLLLYFGLAVIMLVFFCRARGPVAYSYEAILSLGIFLFCTVVLLFELPVYISHLKTPGLYTTWEMISDIASGGKFFMLVTSPLVLIFSLLLIISNIELLRHEPPRFQNVLGMLLGLFMIGAELIFWLWSGRYFQGSYEEYRVREVLENVLGVAFTYAECILFSSVINGVMAGKHVPKRDRDYILILGCGFRKDGTLPPLLRGRVDKAMEFWRRQKEETGKEAVIIPSGGQGRNEPMAEAEAMYRYMVSCGFPEHLIIREDQSVNTYQNMEFSKKIIESRSTDNAKARVAFSTTSYHVFRSGVWAGLAGLEAEGMGSPTKWWFWPNAFMRECVGLLRNRIIQELVVLALLIALFGGITWMFA